MQHLPTCPPPISTVEHPDVTIGPMHPPSRHVVHAPPPHPSTLCPHEYTLRIPTLLASVLFGTSWQRNSFRQDFLLSSHVAVVTNGVVAFTTTTPLRAVEQVFPLAVAMPSQFQATWEPAPGSPHPGFTSLDVVSLHTHAPPGGPRVALRNTAP